MVEKVARLRPAWSPDELKTIYAKPHDHLLYGRGHGERVDATVRLGQVMQRQTGATVGADLSCGNAAILSAIDLAVRYLGDYAPGYRYHGPLETTLREVPAVDLYVCSETLEHVDDPSLVLDLIRQKSGALILSTPIDCWGDTNGEHYWAWSRDGVQGLLENAGWDVCDFRVVDSTTYGEAYKYGIWAAS